MKEKIYEICEEMLENEEESKKFASYETLEELYEYFLDKIPGLSKDEFEEFICEALDSYAKEKERQAGRVDKIGEGDLGEISGGAFNLRTKFTAGLLALMAATSAVPGVGATNVGSVGSSQSISQTQGGESKISNAFSHVKAWVKAHPKLTAGIAIGTLVLAGTGIFLGVRHARKAKANNAVGAAKGSYTQGSTQTAVQNGGGGASKGTPKTGSGSAAVIPLDVGADGEEEEAPPPTPPRDGPAATVAGAAAARSGTPAGTRGAKKTRVPAPAGGMGGVLEDIRGHKRGKSAAIEQMTADQINAAVSKIEAVAKKLLSECKKLGKTEDKGTEDYAKAREDKIKIINSSKEKVKKLLVQINFSNVFTTMELSEIKERVKKVDIELDKAPKFLLTSKSTVAGAAESEDMAGSVGASEDVGLRERLSGVIKMRRDAIDPDDEEDDWDDDRDSDADDSPGSSASKKTTETGSSSTATVVPVEKKKDRSVRELPPVPPKRVEEDKKKADKKSRYEEGRRKSQKS